MIRIGIVGIGFMGMNHKRFLLQSRKTAENAGQIC